MSIFDPAQNSALLALCQSAPYKGLLSSPAALLTALNQPQPIPNPTSQGTVSAPFTAVSLLTACSSANRANLAGFLGTAGPFIFSQNAIYLSDGLDALALIGAISPADATAMVAAMGRTTPDPNWQPRIAGPTPFQALFPGVPFALPDGEVHVGTCTPAMLAEALGS